MDNTNKPWNRAAYIIIGIIIIASVLAYAITESIKASDTKRGYDIPKKNSLVEYDGRNIDILISDLNETTGKTRYLMMASPTCAWCYQYMPYINDYAMKNDIEIWYFNPEKHSGVTVDKYGFYYYDDSCQEKRLGDCCSCYEKVVKFILQTEGTIANGLIEYKEIEYSADSNVSAKVPWINVPSLYKVVDGVTLEKLQTIPGHEKVDGELPPMTEAQKEVLKANIENFFKGE